MERVSAVGMDVTIRAGRITTVGKPPWAEVQHKGKLERLILQLGIGKGKFLEAKGIPRSIGCIGNNRLILYDEPLTIDDFKRVISEFKALGGDLYLTNYDDVSDLVELAKYAVSIGINNVYAVVLLEDVHEVPRERSFKLVVEVAYEELRRASDTLDVADVLLLMARYPEYREVRERGLPFAGEVWIDILYPGSLRFLDFSPIEVRRTVNPTAIAYNPCLAGTLAITPEGFALPCPLLRKFPVGSVREEPLRRIARKQRLRSFWKLTKDNIPNCKRCPLRYTCHDCRALEYQATGDLLGIEFCVL
ncbi:hypothetical protein PYCH_16380 [Pyrococcus yayanosii CH1]|uniref:4Fe4S-binding SPASM domain-containing protein n=1 Tax=Pyrococcus yayanosii (strain CH1 / JCM 16557) TaxID=529709 RepID=F8AH74_PYRYC|nr:hypothetical protein PYCH_16380 [Pyrococcus yayanosii CH1]